MPNKAELTVLVFREYLQIQFLPSTSHELAIKHIIANATNLMCKEPSVFIKQYIIQN